MGSASNPGPSLYETIKAKPRLSGTPRDRGHLVVLPTKAEVQSRLQTAEAFIATVPTRSANNILKC